MSTKWIHPLVFNFFLSSNLQLNYNIVSYEWAFLYSRTLTVTRFWDGPLPSLAVVYPHFEILIAGVRWASSPSLLPSGWVQFWDSRDESSHPGKAAPKRSTDHSFQVSWVLFLWLIDDACYRTIPYCSTTMLRNGWMSLYRMQKSRFVLFFVLLSRPHSSGFGTQ